MTPESRPFDPIALAARLQLWVVEVLAWLLEMLSEGPLAKPLRGWTKAQVALVERGVAGLVVLAALKLLAQPPETTVRRGRRPPHAPRGFRRVALRGDAMRRIVRHLFPRERDLIRRARRLANVLSDLQTRARRLARRIARIMPLTRLALAAPEAMACVALCVCDVRFEESG